MRCSHSAQEMMFYLTIPLLFCRSGLFQVGDEITLVNDTEIRGTNAGYARRKIIGKEGTKVTVGAVRHIIGIGDIEFAVTLTRSSSGVRAAPSQAGAELAHSPLPAQPGVQRVSIALRRGEGGNALDGARLLAWCVSDLPHGSPYKELLQFASDGGVPISKIQQGKGAYEAGLRAWDVIQRVDGCDVRLWSVGDVTSLLQSGGKEGDVLVVSVLRHVNTRERERQLGFNSTVAAEGEEEGSSDVDTEDEFAPPGAQMPYERERDPREKGGWGVSAIE